MYNSRVKRNERPVLWVVGHGLRFTEDIAIAFARQNVKINYTILCHFDHDVDQSI